jgi:hypothetical protein
VTALNIDCGSLPEEKAFVVVSWQWSFLLSSQLRFKFMSNLQCRKNASKRL